MSPSVRNPSGSFDAAPAWRVLAGLVLGLLVATILTAVIALAGLGRLSDEVDWTVVPSWFWYYRADPNVQLWLSIGAGVSGAALSGVALVLVVGRRRPLHGAARWASAADIRRAGLRAASGILLGRTGSRPLVFGGSEHVLLHAPTRTGKGVGVVIPNLLTWPGSCVVLDVKQENWAASAGYRAASGQAVHLFDPLSPTGQTARYNPLGHIRRQNPETTLDELQKIAVMLFPTPARTDPFWTEAARTGFIGVAALVAETPDLPFTMGEVFRQLTSDNPRERLPDMIRDRETSGVPFSDGCTSAVHDFTSAAEKTFASIKQTITSRMALWLNPRVDAATSASDFDLRALRTDPMSIYLGVSPADVGRVAPLYALLTQQIIDLNTRSLPSPGGEPHQVLLVLDEFARLGRAEGLAHAFAYVAGYGLRLLAVLQSPAQLRAIYGPDLAEEIVANCAVEVAFAPKDLKVATELSERLGTYTVASRSRSRPAGLSPGHRSLTFSDQKRALMLAQELMALGPNALLVLKAGVPPLLASKLRYFEHQDLCLRARPAPDVPPLAPLAASARDGLAAHAVATCLTNEADQTPFAAT